MVSPTDATSGRKVDSEEFARVLTKQAAAHVCVALGFTATTAGALECLTDVVQRYMEDMAKRTMENTYRAGRTEANVADVLQGFQQMPIPLNWKDLRDFAFSDDGYTTTTTSMANRNKVSGVSVGGGGGANGGGGGGSDPANSSDARAGDSGDSAAGAGDERPKRWDQPFHHAVPAFPMPRNPTPWGGLAATAGGIVEEGDKGGPGIRPPHIPDFMPPLPPGVGYKRSREAVGGSGRTLGEIRMERSKRQRQIETAMRSLGSPLNTNSATAVRSPLTAAGSTTTGVTSTGTRIKITSNALREGTASAASNHAAAAPTSGDVQRNGSPIRKIKLSTGGLNKKGVLGGNGGGGNGGNGGGMGAGRSSNDFNGPSGPGGFPGAYPPSLSRGGSGSKDGRGSGGSSAGPRVTAVFGKARNGVLGAAGGGVSGSKSSSLPKPGFRAIPPSAAAAKGAEKGISTSDAALATVGLKSRAGKGGIGGGEKRGPFGRVNDSTREDRILEGIPPDGGGDIEGAV